MAVVQEESTWIEEIRALASANTEVTVVCDGDYEMAGEFVKELKAKEKAVRAWIAPMVKKAHEAHKEAKARENEIVKPLVAAYKAIGAEMGRYHCACLERDKQELEIARVAEQEIANAGAEEYAQNLEAQGLGNLAEAARNNVPVVQPTVETTAPKVAGTSARKTWKYEIVDENAVPLKYMCVDEKLIAAIVRAKKGSTSIPGVRVWSETNVS